MPAPLPSVSSFAQATLIGISVLPAVDWKPQSAGSLGLWSSLHSLAEGLFGQSSIGRLLARDPSLSTLGLDGLVSVWHPSEN